MADNNPAPAPQPPPPNRGPMVAIIFVVLLIAGAIWVGNGIIAMVKQQNCAMSGRHDCLDPN